MKTITTIIAGAFALSITLLAGPLDRNQQTSVRLRGEIRQVMEQGLIVEAHFGNVRMPKYNAGTSRPALVKGDFLLIGHPTRAQKVDHDWFDVDAVEEGIFDYTTVLGANKRIRKYRVVKAYY